jgi:hypothetical protein
MFTAVNRLWQRALSLSPEMYFELSHMIQCKGYDVDQSYRKGKAGWYHVVHPGGENRCPRRRSCVMWGDVGY